MLTHDTLDSRPQARRSTRQCLQVRSLRQAETAAAQSVQAPGSRPPQVPSNKPGLTCLKLQKHVAQNRTPGNCGQKIIESTFRSRILQKCSHFRQDPSSNEILSHGFQKLQTGKCFSLKFFWYLLVPQPSSTLVDPAARLTPLCRKRKVWSNRLGTWCNQP